MAPQLPPRPHGRTAMIHFLVTEDTAEVQDYARARGWFDQGFTALTIAWLELHFTTDGWATTRVLKSTDVPSPVVDGWFYLPSVSVGENVEFAVHVGLTCRKPEDHAQAMFRDQGSLWFNNDGANYTQTAR